MKLNKWLKWINSWIVVNIQAISKIIIWATAPVLIIIAMTGWVWLVWTWAVLYLWILIWEAWLRR